MADSNVVAATPAAPGTVAPAPAATPSPVAPSAPATPAQPLTLADYDALAANSLRKNAGVTEPPQPAPAAVAPPGQESPPETPAAEAQTPEVTPDPAPAVEPEATEGDEIEPSAEEQSTWTEGERRLHGALVKERQKNKEARAEFKQLKEELAQIKTKLNPTPQAPATELPAPATPAPAPTPSVGAPALADCNTFEAIDARVMQAAAAESAAVRLQNTFLSRGLDAVLPQLAKHGLVVDGDNLVDVNSKAVLGPATEETVGNFIANVFDGAKQVQAQAEPRKAFLKVQGQSWAEAVKIMPKLADHNSEDFKRIAHFVRGNPLLQTRADWPVVAVKLYLGEQAWASKVAPPAATPPPAAKPAATPAPRSAPGAPRASGAALPKSSELETLRAKIANGTATLDDVDRKTSLELQANASR